MSTVTTNMGLTIPTPNVDSGAVYTAAINGDLALLDTHDHSLGKGVTIGPAGMNINQDLTFQSNNAIAVKALCFTSQSVTLTAVLYRPSLYTVSNDLYYTNGSGTAIQLTSGSSLNTASIGGISGLGGTTASVTWDDSNKIFSFSQASNFAAKVAYGDILLYDISGGAGGNYETIKAPASVGAGVTITMPAFTGALASLGSTSQTFAGALVFSGALTVNANIDTTAANRSIHASLGANTLTLAGASSTVNVPGSLTVAGASVPSAGSSTTFSNKTLDNTCTITLKDTLFTLQDDGDITKQLQFQLSGISTSTTRTLTIPNASDTIVVLTVAQELTNKTLTAALIKTSLDVNAAGSFTIAGSVGANTLTLAGASSTVAVAGALTVGSTGVFTGAIQTTALTATATTNQLILGTTRTITFSAIQPATSSRVYTFRDFGADGVVGMGTAGNNLRFTTTGDTTITLPTSGTMVTTASKLNVFASTSSSELASVISDGRTGTGALVCATTPTLATPVIGAATGTSVALSSWAELGGHTGTTMNLQIKGTSTTAQIGLSSNNNYACGNFGFDDNYQGSGTYAMAFMASGATFNSTNFTAQVANPVVLGVGNAGLYLFFDTGKTVSNTYSPTEKVRITATVVSFRQYGVGTATFDGSGNISSVSSQKMKTNIQDFKYGLAEVLRLQPRTFNWNEDSGLNQKDFNAGLIAEEVQTVMPDFVTINPQGMPNYQDRAIVNAMVKGIQELSARVVALEAR